MDFVRPSARLSFFSLPPSLLLSGSLAAAADLLLLVWVYEKKRKGKITQSGSAVQDIRLPVSY